MRRNSLHERWGWQMSSRNLLFASLLLLAAPSGADGPNGLCDCLCYLTEVYHQTEESMAEYDRMAKEDGVSVDVIPSILPRLIDKESCDCMPTPQSQQEAEAWTNRFNLSIARHGDLCHTISFQAMLVDILGAKATQHWELAQCYYDASLEVPQRKAYCLDYFQNGGRQERAGLNQEQARAARKRLAPKADGGYLYRIPEKQP